MNKIDYSQFDELVKDVERLGADMDKIAETVLDAGSEPTRQAYAKKIPYDTTTPSNKRKHGHARDNLKVSRTKRSRSGGKYRLVEATDKEFNYLWYLEKGTSRINERKFIQKAYDAAKKAAQEPMKQALLKEIEKHIK